MNELELIQKLLEVTKSIKEKGGLPHLIIEYNKLIASLKFYVPSKLIQKKIKKSYRHDLFLAAEIQQYVCYVYDVELEQLHSKTRDPRIVDTRRKIASMIMDNTSTLSLNEIGEYVGRKHADVIHLHKTLDDFMDTDNKYRKEYTEILKDKYKYKKYKPYEFHRKR